MRGVSRFLNTGLKQKYCTFFSVSVGSTFSAFSAVAAPFAADFIQGTDAGAEHLFLVNPATYIPKSIALGLAENRQNQTIDVEDTRDNVLTKISNKGTRSNHGVGFMVAPSSGLGLGINFTNQSEDVASTNDQSFWRQVAQQENRLRRELAGRLALEFTPNFRVGVLFRYQVLKANVLGSFNAQPSERSSYAGSLYGGGIGFSFIAGTGAVGAAYLSPLRGKVKVEGESKVTTDPGLVIANGYFDLAKNFRAGLYWTKWLHEKDELAQTTTSPDKVRRTQIILLGVNTDSRLYRTQALGLGLDGKFSEKLGVRATVSREQAEFVTSPDKLPGEPDNKSNSLTFYRVRSGFFLQTGDFGAQLGADSNARKHTRIPSETQTIKYKSEELGYYASVNLTL